MGFLFIHDLNFPDESYELLWVELKRLGARRVLLSAWYLIDDRTCAQLRDHLAEFLDHNDKWLVVNVDDWAGYKLLSPLG